MPPHYQQVAKQPARRRSGDVAQLHPLRDHEPVDKNLRSSIQNRDRSSGSARRVTCRGLTLVAAIPTVAMKNAIIAAADWYISCNIASVATISPGRALRLLLYTASRLMLEVAM